MSKTNKIRLAAVGVIFAGLILLAVSWILNNKSFSNYSMVGTGSGYTEKTYTCQNDIDKIIVRDTSNEVYVVPSPGLDKIKITYYVSKDRQEYDISEAKGELTFVRKSTKKIHFYWGINLKPIYVKVEVPEKSLDEVNVQCSSGSITISGLNSKDVVALATSGSVKVTDINAESIIATATSGSVNLENIKADSLVTNATSGAIRLTNSSTDSYISGTTSGSVKLTSVEAKECALTTTSGGISFDKLSTQDLVASATSGSVKGTISGNESDYAIATKTTSGSCNLDDKTTGKYSMTLKTTSGSIKVSFE